MKELLYIPTGGLVRFTINNKLCAFGQWCNSLAYTPERVLGWIMLGLFSIDFYSRNNMPSNAAIEEFEVIEIND